MSTDYTPTTEEVREAYPHASILPPFYSPEHAPAVEAKLAEFDRWLAETLTAHDREVAAKALEDYAAILDQEHAEDAARSRVADVRCLDCDLRHEERDEYSCGQPGRGHYYAPDSLAHAATVTIEPTWDGNQARARAAALRIEGKEDQ